MRKYTADYFRYGHGKEEGVEITGLSRGGENSASQRVYSSINRGRKRNGASSRSELRWWDINTGISTCV